MNKSSILGFYFSVKSEVYLTQNKVNKWLLETEAVLEEEGAEALADPGKCTRQNALTVATNAKSLSSRKKEDLSTAGIAIRNIESSDWAD